jgi:hypothetical protein
VASRGGDAVGFGWRNGKEKELTGGACGSVRGERGGTEIGSHKLKGETYFGEGANDMHARWAGEGGGGLWRGAGQCG